MPGAKPKPMSSDEDTGTAAFVWINTTSCALWLRANVSSSTRAYHVLHHHWLQQLQSSHCTEGYEFTEPNSSGKFSGSTSFGISAGPTIATGTGSCPAAATATAKSAKHSG